MCGITGFCDFNKKSTKQILKNMTDVLYHRGPDDSGYSFYYLNNCNIGLGHRRLSILDLSNHGHQPMKFDNFEIVYNGEVYNFQEIKNELIKYRYSFESNSDTEVILKAYHKWGIKAIDKFNGMFAIAIYDKKKQKLILIRDRAGVKPLYYYYRDNIFIFGSELKSFHQNIYFQKQISEESLAIFLQMGYIPEPHSIFENTFKLKSGYYLEFDLTTKQLQEYCYWNVLDYYKKPKLKLDENEIIEKTERLLQSAFEYRMVSDVPVGMFLSGGYDSSLVTAILQKNRTQKLKTFTIGFYEENYNEAHYAKEVATYLGTDHTEYYATFKEAQEIIPNLSYFYDEPFGDQSAIPTILVSKIARQQVTVSLSADGGDEIFGGYGKYLPKHEKTIKIANYLNKIFTKRQIEYIAHKLQRLNIIDKHSFENNVSKIIYGGNNTLINLISFFAIPLMQEKLIKGYIYTKLITNFDLIEEIKEQDEINQMLALDYKTYMVDDILTKVDRATMSVSLEGREPLLDYRIIEFVAQIDSKLKIKNGNTKYLLKQITHKYIPKQIMDRPKKGFAIPVHLWLKNELKEYMEEYFSNYDSKILNKIELNNIKNLFYQDKINFQLVWNILMFQMWHKRWM